MKVQPPACTSAIKPPTVVEMAKQPVGPVEAELAEVTVRRANLGSVEIYPRAHTAPASVTKTLRDQGAPLDARTRSFFERRFSRITPARTPAPTSVLVDRSPQVGDEHDLVERDADDDASRVFDGPDDRGSHSPGGVDFSNVRIHTDAEAVRSARAIGARAYALGNHVVFGADQFDPWSLQGRALLAHELAHVVRPGAETIVRRQLGDPPPPDLRHYPIRIPAGLRSRDDLFRIVERAIFHREMGWTWQAQDADGENLLAHVSQSAGRWMSFNVPATLLEQYGVQPPDPATTQLGGANLGAKPVVEKQKLADLPDDIRALLGKTKNLPPDQSEILARIVDKLSRLSLAELEDFKSKITGESEHLQDLEYAVDEYLREKAAREQREATRDALATRLEGLEDLYDLYKAYQERKGVVDARARTRAPWSREAAESAAKAVATARHKLEEALKASNFADIAEFEHLLDQYEQVFLDETVALADELLLKYEHVLHQYEKRYKDDKAVDALRGRVVATDAPKLARAAGVADRESSLLRDQGRFSEAQGQGEKATDLRVEAAAQIGELAGKDPIVGERKFDRLSLVGADPKQIKQQIADFIAERRADIAKTRTSLAKNKHNVHSIPPLVEESKRRQSIQPGSIQDRVLCDRREGNRWDGSVKDREFVEMIVLAALTMVGGPIGAAAALASVPISGRQALEAFERYELESSASGAGLLDEDPSVAWVVIAIVGVAADMGSAVAAVKLVHQSRVLALVDDTAKFHAKLRSLPGLQKQFATAIEEALDARKAYEAAVIQAKVELVEGAVGATSIGGGVLTPPKFLGFRGMAYYAIKRRIRTFQAWLIDLKAQSLLKQSKLTPAQVAELKQAWNEAEVAIRSGKGLPPDVELAIKVYKPEPSLKFAYWGPRPSGGSSGEAFARQVSGSKRSIYIHGLDKELKGTGMVEFDDYHKADRVLIDAKDASSSGRYASTASDEQLVNEATRQAIAARHAGAAGVEWHISNPGVADRIRKLLKKRGFETTITVLAVKKIAP